MHCPLLQAVNLSTWTPEIEFKTEPADILIDISRFATLLGFKNLIEISLDLCFSSYWQARHLTTDNLGQLKTLVEGSPGLKSFELSLYFDDDETDGTPDQLVASFGEDIVFPYLKKLHIVGVELPKDSLFGSPTTGSHAFRDFLARHPHITDLCLDFRTSADWYDVSTTNPEHLGYLLPSLRRFKSQSILCLHLIRSTAVAQLEYLGFLDADAAIGLDPGFPMSISPMPALRELHIGRDEFPEVLDLMRLLIPSIGGLEDLRFSADLNDYETELFELLEHIPKLRKLGPGDVYGFKMSENLTEQIKAKYPNVEIVPRYP